MGTLLDYWPIVAFATLAVFGAGSLVEKIRNGRYVSKNMCEKTHADLNRLADDRWERICRDLDYIRAWIDDHGGRR